MKPPKCAQCGETDPTKFWRNGRSTTGYRAYCKACERPKQQTPEARRKRNEAAKRYYAKHLRRPRHHTIKLATARLRIIARNLKARVEIMGVTGISHVATYSFQAETSGVSGRGMIDRSHDDEMIARFIKERGVTRLSEDGTVLCKIR